MKNKIGWCSKTFNPVWGCLNHCEYCYARKIAKRFSGKMAEYEIDFIYGGSIDSNSLIAFYDEKKENIRNFKPTFLESQFDKKFPKKPQRIFVGSMSEIAHWDKIWIQKVLDKIKEYPQHTFQFLTKEPEVYSRYIFPENCWLGITVTNSKDSYSEFHIAPENKDNIFFVCIEPMFDYIPIDCIDYADWVIIGSETGNRKGKIIPKKAWVLTMIEQLRHRNIPIYLKDSILKLYPEIIKAYPSFHLFPDKDNYGWFRRTRIDWSKRELIKGGKY